MSLRLSFERYFQREAMIRHRLMGSFTREFSSKSSEGVPMGSNIPVSRNIAVKLKSNRDENRIEEILSPSLILRNFEMRQQQPASDRSDITNSALKLQLRNHHASADFTAKVTEFKERYIYVAPGRHSARFHEERDRLVSELLDSGFDTLAYMLLTTTKDSFVCHDEKLLPRLVELIDKEGSIYDLSDFYDIHVDKEDVYLTYEHTTRLQESAPEIERLTRIFHMFTDLRNGYIRSSSEIESTLKTMAASMKNLRMELDGLQKLATSIFAQAYNHAKLLIEIDDSLKVSLFGIFGFISIIPKRNYSLDLLIALAHTPIGIHDPSSIPYERRLEMLSRCIDSTTSKGDILRIWATLFKPPANNEPYIMMTRDVALFEDIIFPAPLDIQELEKMKDSPFFEACISVLTEGFMRYKNHKAVVDLWEYRVTGPKKKEPFNWERTAAFVSYASMGEYDRAYSIAPDADDFIDSIDNNAYILLVKVLKALNKDNDIATLLRKIETSEDFKQREDSQRFSMEYLSHLGEPERLRNAWNAFIENGFKPDSNLLCDIIEGHLRHQWYQKASQWFHEFARFDIPMTVRGYELMLRNLVGKNDIQPLFNLLDQLATLDAAEYKFTRSSFIPILEIVSQNGDYNVVCTVTDYYMPKFQIPRSTDDYNYMIKALYQSNRFQDVLNLFDSLNSNGKISYDTFHYALLAASKRYFTSTVFKKYWRMTFTDERVKKFMDAKLYSIQLSRFVLDHGLNKNIKEKLNMLNERSPIDITTFNGLISASVSRQSIDDIVQLLDLMISYKIRPNKETYSLLGYLPYIPTSSVTSEKSRSLKKTIQKLTSIFYLSEQSASHHGALLDPSAFLFYIRGLVHYGATIEAKQQYERYVDIYQHDPDVSIPLRSAKLLLTGAEYEPVSYANALKSFIDLVKPELERQSTLQQSNKKTLSALDFHITSNVFRDDHHSLPDDLSEREVLKVKLPDELKTALFPIWGDILKHYKLKEKEKNVVPFVYDLKKTGFHILDNMMSHVALLISRKYFQEAILFVDKELVFGPLSLSELKRAKDTSLDLADSRRGSGLTLELYQGIVRNLRSYVKNLKYSQRKSFFEAVKRVQRVSIIKHILPDFVNLRRIILFSKFRKVTHVRMKIIALISKYKSPSFQKVNGKMKRGKNLFFVRQLSLIRNACLKPREIGVSESTNETKAQGRSRSRRTRMQKKTIEIS